jgi:hypothetical protein
MYQNIYCSDISVSHGGEYEDDSSGSLPSKRRSFSMRTRNSGKNLQDHMTS